MGQQARRRDAPRSAVPRRLVGSAGRRPARLARYQPATRRPARRQHPGRQRHAQRRLCAAPDFDHLRPGQPVPRGAGGIANVPARSLDPVKTLSAGSGRHRRRARRAGAAVGGGNPDTHHRAARDLASGAIPCRFTQLQPRARRSAGRRGRGGEIHRDADRHALQHCRRLCRRCSGGFQIAGRAALADPRRHRHHLHRARRAL